MISTLIGLLGLAGWGGGALGIAGVALKLLGKFAPSAAATVLSNPITAAVSKVAEGFVDLVLWAAKGVLGYIGAWLAGGFDHISKDTRSFAILMLVSWGSYSFGLWRAPDPPPPPPAKSAPAKPTPKAAAAKSKAEEGGVPNPLGWFDSVWR